VARVLAVVGACCNGKTVTIDALNELLQWDRLSIDAERTDGGDWTTLARKVMFLRVPTIVESIAMPKLYRDALKRHDATVVLVFCDPAERARREQVRGDVRPIGRNYSRSEVHCRIDATAALDDDTLARIAQMARTPYGRRFAGATQHP
jgi:hypothetical protein